MAEKWQNFIETKVRDGAKMEFNALGGVSGVALFITTDEQL